MKFGYFFLGMSLDSDGPAFSSVQIRPMEGDVLMKSGMNITVKVPIHARDCELSLVEVAQKALEAAQQLLPESALAAWGKQWEGPLASQPCFPANALAEWNKAWEPSLDMLSSTQN